MYKCEKINVMMNNNNNGKWMKIDNRLRGRKRAFANAAGPEQSRLAQNSN